MKPLYLYICLLPVSVSLYLCRCLSLCSLTFLFCGFFLLSLVVVSAPLLLPLLLLLLLSRRSHQCWCCFLSFLPFVSSSIYLHVYLSKAISVGVNETLSHSLSAYLFVYFSPRSLSLCPSLGFYFLYCCSLLLLPPPLLPPLLLLLQ